MEDARRRTKIHFEKTCSSPGRAERGFVQAEAGLCIAPCPLDSARTERDDFDGVARAAHFAAWISQSASGAPVARRTLPPAQKSCGANLAIVDVGAMAP